MNEFENFKTRSAIKQLQIIVTQELDDLHHDKRDRDDVIARQKKQIKILSENSKYNEVRINQALDVAHISICWMYFAFIVAAISLGALILALG